MAVVVPHYIKGKSFRAIFFDVGQGEAVLLHFPSGENILVDCGSKSQDDVGRWIVLPYFSSSTIRKI